VGVTDGQRGNQTTLNNAFMARNADTSTTGAVNLASSATADGTAVTSSQKEHNSIASFVGKTLNTAKDAVPSWASDIVGSASQTVKARIESIVALFRDTAAHGGHIHTGADGQGPKILPANFDSTGGSTGQLLSVASGGGYEHISPAAVAIPDTSGDLINHAVATSMASNALTIALKTKAGTDPSGTDSVGIGFRSATATSGVFVERSAAAALSMVVSSGSTLGHASGADHYIYVYLIDNAGTVELAVSSALFDEGSIQNTTTEGGAGAADSNAVLYSTTGRTGVAVRLIARLKSNQATAGTWATAIAEISLVPFERPKIVARYSSTAGQSISSATVTIVDFATKAKDNLNAVTTGASWKFTAPKAADYRVSSRIVFASAAYNPATFQLDVYVNGSFSRNLGVENKESGASTYAPGTQGSTIVTLAAGDYIDFRVTQTVVSDATAKALVTTAGWVYADIQEI
jgi:hypothetical protein